MNARNTGTFATALAGLLALALGEPGWAESIVKSKHNLGASSSAAIRADTESQVCIFCHTPHNSTKEAPLWNRSSSGVTYTPYRSSTVKAQIGQPTGASKVCLSCHDGTIALGKVHSRATPITFRNQVTSLPSGRSMLGTDLSGEHPISFAYDAALSAVNDELVTPQTLTRKVKLDHSGQMQCTSCHDPHNDQFGMFLVQDNTGSALCLNCHNLKSWAASSHATSSKTWSGAGPNPWPHTSYKTVADNACENCHTPHAAGGKPRLLNSALDEQNCYSCHNGTVAAKNIAADFTKPSGHPVTLSQELHDPNENPLTAPRHVACSDCHNPHATRPGNTAVPMLANAAITVVAPLSPAIASTKGINAAGAPVKEISNEYELCYKCHADSPGRGQARVARQFAQTNARLQFSPGNASFHPVQATGRNANVPSLILPWRNTSRMRCTDCHNSDSSPSAGGTGPSGPHGSIYAPLLERQLVLTDFQPESPANYALCYKCHSRSSILSDQSFKAVNSLGQDRGHRFHIIDQQTSCATCHDSHGSANNANLLNFNANYVTPASNGQLQYLSTGPGRGNCTLTCHGKNHVATPYPGQLSSPAILKATPLLR